MSQDFDVIAPNYEALLTASLKGFGGEMAYYPRRKAQIARAICPGAVTAFLDYGCGTGVNLPFLHQAFPQARAVGCDVSAASLGLAKEAAPWAEFFLCDETVPKAAFDLVFVSGVLHHVEKAKRPGVVTRMATALAPGGRLLIFEHNPFNPVTRRIVSHCPFDTDAVLLRPAEMRRLLAEAGLIETRWSYTLFFPASLGFLAGLERHLGRLPLGGQYVTWAMAPALNK